MAKNKTKRGASKAPEPLTPMWMGMGALAAVGAVGLFISCGFPDWRVTKEVTINWSDNWERFNAQFYNPTKFGIYAVSFNGGVIKDPWSQRADFMCATITSFTPIDTAINLFTDNPCSPLCVQHYRIRCEVYQRLKTINFVVLGSSMIVGLLALVGAGWLFAFGKNVMLLQLFWLGGGVANLCAIVWWIYESDYGFDQLRLQSQYPYPSVGPAAKGGIACSLAIFAAGFLVTIAFCFKDSCAGGGDGGGGSWENESFQHPGLGTANSFSPFQVQPVRAPFVKPGKGFPGAFGGRPPTQSFGPQRPPQGAFPFSGLQPPTMAGPPVPGKPGLPRAPPAARYLTPQQRYA